MFVKSNNFKAVRAYFSEELKEIYSQGELKIVLKYLFLKHYNVSASEYILADEKRLSESDLLSFHNALKRLRNNEPFQHVIGETEFYGLHLLSDARALIPRPETEELVDWILQEHQQLECVLDVCSGSGCVALALKANRPDAKVFALEFSLDAIGLMKDNRNHVNLEFKTLHADALNSNYYSLVEEKVDALVSNPPYIPNEDRKIMESNVLDFEPEMALFVEDDDPLLFYREILERSTTVLKENGWVYFEIHEDLGKEVITLFEQLNFVNIELRKDLQNKDRMVRGQMVTCVHEREGSHSDN